MPRRRSLIGQLPLPNLSCENPDDMDYYLRLAIAQASDPGSPLEARKDLFRQYARSLHRPRYHKLAKAFCMNPSSTLDMIKIAACYAPKALFQNPLLPLLLLETPSLFQSFPDLFFSNLSRARSVDRFYPLAGPQVDEVEVKVTSVTKGFRAFPLGAKLFYHANDYVREHQPARRDRQMRWWTLKGFADSLSGEWVSSWLHRRKDMTGVSFWAPLTWREVTYIVRELPYGSYFEATHRAQTATP